MAIKILSIVVSFLPIVIAIILHEVAHGYAAYRLGDDTAKRYGRLSLNPVRHADLFGTIILPSLLIFSGTGFVIGWAKPVPVNFNNLNHPKRDTIIVSAAGIVVNFILAVISALLLRLVPYVSGALLQGMLSLFLLNMVVFNIVLAMFNLLPIPPLDGSKIFLSGIDIPWVQKYLNSEKAGLLAIVAIAFILPVIGDRLGYNWNILGSYLIRTSKFFISLLL